MDYTLAQVRGYQQAIVRMERERMLSAAIAHRAAQTDADGWQIWLDSVNGQKAR